MEPRQHVCLTAKLQYLEEEERRLVETVCALQTEASHYDDDNVIEIAQLEGRREVAQEELEAVQAQRDRLVKAIRDSA